MPLGQLTLESFRAHLSGRRPHGSSRTRRRDYISCLACEHLWFAQEELESAAGEKDTWNTSLSLLALRPDLRQVEENKWMDGWMEEDELLLCSLLGWRCLMPMLGACSSVDSKNFDSIHSWMDPSIHPFHPFESILSTSSALMTSGHCVVFLDLLKSKIISLVFVVFRTRVLSKHQSDVGPPVCSGSHRYHA